MAGWVLDSLPARTDIASTGALVNEKMKEFMSNILDTVYGAISIHLIHKARFSLKYGAAGQ